MILIVTEKFDPHTDIIQIELNKRGISSYRFHLSDFPTKISVSYFAGHSQPGILKHNNNEILLSSIHSVWYRRTESFSFPDFLAKEELDIARRECNSFIHGLWKAIPHAKWISIPEKIQEASIKVEQLIRAETLGFNILPTCFSNDPETIFNFFKAYATSRKILYKTHTPVMVSHADGKVGVAYAVLLDDDKLKKIEEIRNAPGIFQVYMPKKYDIRVTIIGDKIFSCKIDSQSSFETYVDCRAYSWGSGMLPGHQQYALPCHIADKCIELIRSYGLEFGAIDLVNGQDGNYYFLELNPNGQWAWIQEVTGMPMKEAFIDLLCSV
jgi:glutathione synthase/RimK-type ligase-like ATP-grasp enzyme